MTTTSATPRCRRLHGGVIGALLESAAILHLVWDLEAATIPKTINMSIDYLRPGARSTPSPPCTATRQGRQITNVRGRGLAGLAQPADRRRARSLSARRRLSGAGDSRSRKHPREDSDMADQGSAVIVRRWDRGSARPWGRRFAAAGCTVLLASRTRDKVERIAAEIRAAGGDATRRRSTASTRPRWRTSSRAPRRWPR